MKYRVQYVDPTTHSVLLTGITTLSDAMLKAAFLNGTVVEDDNDE